MEGKHDWKFCTIGGVTRVNIEDGADIAHLGELDQKLWTVLSCPVEGLEVDPATLKLLDTDCDGSVRVGEVVAAAEWMTASLRDVNALFKREDSIALADFNTETEQGRLLRDSAARILSNLGKEQDTISLAETSDTVAIFAGTKFNGDGIVTPASTDDAALAQVITDAAATIKASTDRSGEAGVDTETVEAFYAACADYAAWQAEAEAAKTDIFPYGDGTAAALAACEALEDKIADYFMRCKLASFNAASVPALDVSVDRISEISARDLSTCSDEIASYPLARVEGGLELPFKGINPAWQAAFDTLKALVLDVKLPGRESMTESEWLGILAGFGAYKAWIASRKGAQVEGLGLDRVKEVIAQDRKADVLGLIAQDNAVEAEAAAICSVDKFLHLYRDFVPVLRNFVTFADFYSPDKDIKAVFQAGTLYIDQRSCDLCIKVSNMGAHAATAGTSGLFLVYCECVSKVKGETMTIAAAMTEGDVSNIRPGKHGVFYDRSGLDWYATVTSVVDNPISVAQAFWSPYRKVARLVEKQVEKMAADKDAKVMGDATAKISTAEVPADGAAKKAPFDIAKFAGIFAAIGLAVGAIGAALAALLKAFVSLSWWKMLLVIAAVLLLISGPAMIIAWIKLRKRSLSPVLNANGWAINSAVGVNIKFGRTLTSVAKYPKVAAKDPYSDAAPWWKRTLWGIVFIAAGFAALYFTDNLKCFGLPYHKEDDEMVEVNVTIIDDDADVEVVEAVESVETDE